MSNTVFLLGLVLIFPCILIGIILPWVRRYGSLQVKTDQDKNRYVFRQRIQDRVSGMCIAIFLIGGFILECYQMFSDAALHHHPVPAWGCCVAFLYGWMIFGFGGLILWLTGPRDLILDLDRHQYEFISGNPLRPHVDRGNLDDLAGVYIRGASWDEKSGEYTRKGYRTATYFVEIAWRKPHRSCPLLGRFCSKNQAEAFAEEMAALLGIPRIQPPPRGQVWVSPNHPHVSHEGELPPVRLFRPLFPHHETTDQPR